MKIYYCVGLKELAKASVTTKEFFTAVEGVLREIGQNDFQAFIQRLSKLMTPGNSELGSS